jgi:hypothetical protein
MLLDGINGAVALFSATLVILLLEYMGRVPLAIYMAERSMLLCSM